jgi:N-acyl-D-aspartate/D-glutamate deacylase
MLSISPWHGVTTVVIGNCGFGVAPTRPEHRDLILRTLESVEGMSLEALRAGVGEDWPFETFPEYMDAIEARGTAINVGVLLGHTPLRLYVMGAVCGSRK